MKAIIQRVSNASVQVNGNIVGKIERGICVLLGIHKSDTQEDVDYIISRLLTTKLWPDKDNCAQWKQSVTDIQGQILVISQFTLYGIVGRNGRAPDFHLAMKAETSKDMYELFIFKLKQAIGREDAIQCKYRYIATHLIFDSWSISSIYECINSK